ncbi:MAG: CvpA family protein [Anaerovoracaceae bacterium]|jgi:uncharacterized membrane protein required for colicin V production
MWIDIIIVIILIYAIIQGFRNGFVRTLFYTVGWLVAVVLGFAWYPHVVDYLKEKTDFYHLVHGKVLDRFTESAGTATGSIIDSLPNVLQDLFAQAFENAGNAMASSFADSLSHLIFNLIGFLVVILVMKLALSIITSLFSKKSRGGIVGGIDGFLGLLAGGATGVIIVYISLALLVPFASLYGSTTIMNGLEDSIIGNYMYNNNLLLALLGRS